MKTLLNGCNPLGFAGDPQYTAEQLYERSFAYAEILISSHKSFGIDFSIAKAFYSTVLDVPDTADSWAMLQIVLANHVAKQYEKWSWKQASMFDFVSREAANDPTH